MRMNNELLGKLGILSVAAVLATAGLSGCKDGDTTDADDEVGDGDGDMTGDGDGDGELVCTTHDPGDGAAEGEACYSNDDCASKVCERFQDSPPVDGSCELTTDMCRTRIMGRVLDFTTRATVDGVDLRVVAAINASVDPVGAAALASATSDADGLIDTVSDGQISAPLGIVGLAEGGGFYLTATGLASPAESTFYGPANSIRDIWAVPAAALTDWSGYLEGDAAFADQLPLGDAGGVVGLVRDMQTGEPIANAKIVPADPDTSGAVIRYLNEAGDGFVTDVTSSQGVFVIVKPGLGETFGVEVNGQAVPNLEGRAGSAANAIFTLIMNVP